MGNYKSWEEMKLKKLIMLFLLVSFMCFGEEKIEPKKSYEVIQREEILIKKIDELTKKVEALENKEMKNIVYKDDEGLSLVYNVDQIYQNSVQYYDKTVKFIIFLITGVGAVLAILLGLLSGFNNKKLKEERAEIRDDAKDLKKEVKEIMKEKKEEITKEVEKRLEEIRKENKQLKEKIEEQEKEVERKTLELDKKIEESEINIEVVQILTDGRVVDKERAFENLIARYPNLSSVYLHYGDYFYRDRREYENAIKWYEKALKIDNTNSEVYSWIGIAYEQLGDYNINNKKENYEEALKNYERAIKLEPNIEDSIIIKERIEKVQKALKKLEEK